MRIDSSEISVVIQGAIIPKETVRCIQSIRKYLPQAEIILSTWKDQDIQRLDYNKIILSDDPGSVGVHYFRKQSVPYNFNRQLISTVEGVKAAERTYVLKIRTDFYLKSNKFLKFFDLFQKQNDCYKLFRHRVIVPSVFSRRYSEQTGFPLLYHPSDFFFFGFKEDIFDYCSHCKLIDKEQGCDWHYKYPDRKPYVSETGRYTAEQEFCIAWLRSHNIEINYEDFSDWNDKSFILSDKILFNNFIFLDPNSIGLGSKKHWKKLLKAQYYPWYGLITQKLFETKYLEC